VAESPFIYEINTWTGEHPEYFIHGTKEDLSGNPAAFLEVGDHIIACGKDPYFPAWPDVLQLNAFHPGLRQAVAEILEEIASQCDVLHCDTAMLVMNTIVERDNERGYQEGDAVTDRSVRPD
jgi:hypothetical protein